MLGLWTSYHCLSRNCTGQRRVQGNVTLDMWLKSKSVNISTLPTKLSPRTEHFYWHNLSEFKLEVRTEYDIIQCHFVFCCFKSHVYLALRF